MNHHFFNQIVFFTHTHLLINSRAEEGKDEKGTNGRAEDGNNGVDVVEELRISRVPVRTRIIRHIKHLWHKEYYEKLRKS